MDSLGKHKLQVSAGEPGMRTLGERKQGCSGRWGSGRVPGEGGCFSACLGCFLFRWGQTSSLREIVSPGDVRSEPLGVMPAVQPWPGSPG